MKSRMINRDLMRAPANEIDPKEHAELFLRSEFNHAEGLTLKTREGQDFLCINGIQTMSAQSYNLLHEIPDMLEMGIDIVRISPQKDHINTIIAAFDSARRGEPIQPDSQNWSSSGLVDGYWFGDAGIRQHHTQALARLGA